MRVFFDSNVLLSAALWPHGATAACYRSAVAHEHVIVVSDYVLDEVRRVAERKFPARVGVIEQFLVAMRDFTVQVGTPTKATSEESAVRDEADRPVLRGAKAAGCDFLVTGDRDLLEADIRSPSVLTPAEYVSRYSTD